MIRTLGQVYQKEAFRPTMWGRSRAFLWNQTTKSSSKVIAPTQCGRTVSGFWKAWTRSAALCKAREGLGQPSHVVEPVLPIFGATASGLAYPCDTESRTWRMVAQHACHRYLAVIHPQDRPSMADTIKMMHEQRCGCDITQRIVRPDGETRCLF